MRTEVDGDYLNVTTRRPTVEPVLFADVQLATLMQDVVFDLVLKKYETMCIILYYVDEHFIHLSSFLEFCAFQGYYATIKNTFLKIQNRSSLILKFYATLRLVQSLGLF